MAMDFFEHQELARQNTKKLIVLFVSGVVAIIVSVHAAVSLVAWQTTSRISSSAWESGRSVEAVFLNAELFGWVALGVIAVVSAGSLYKISALGSGGEKVATNLGGTRLDPGTEDPGERQLLNVVEEMAIASGVPVPPVFVMEREESINAFAAGFEPGDAVIGVTRGAVRHLDRDELQGVIAHEFSHLLNGDMRLNIRLIGVLHG
ncbi:MAG: M48 family metalloprotease, partial [Longimicrobiales bacterium]